MVGDVIDNAIKESLGKYFLNVDVGHQDKLILDVQLDRMKNICTLETSKLVHIRFVENPHEDLLNKINKEIVPKQKLIILNISFGCDDREQNFSFFPKEILTFIGIEDFEHLDTIKQI